jgi:hypothetical protein
MPLSCHPDESVSNQHKIRFFYNKDSRQELQYADSTASKSSFRPEYDPERYRGTEVR